MNITELQDKLKKLNINISGREMSSIWGIDETSFSRKKREGSDIKHKNIQQLEEKLGINLTSNSNTDNILVDYYPDVCGSCGNGVFEFSTKKELIAVPKSAFSTHFSSSKQYFVINAIGNSMEPLIYDGDKLIIEHYDGEQIKDNRPYLFCRNNEIFIKRLAKNVDELLIIPENKMYSVRKLEGEKMNEVDILGQVVGLMRDLR